MTESLARAEALIASIPDYPTPGVLFRDILPMLADADALRTVTTELISPFAGEFDVVAGVEARGFLLAGCAAIAAGVGLVPIRKAGKLPRPSEAVDYSLEYGTATLEIQSDIAPGSRVLLIDDVLATGGTLAAAIELVKRIGATPAGVSVLLEIESLGGRSKLKSLSTHTVFADR